MKWYRKSAEQGYTEAEYELGRLYEERSRSMKQGDFRIGVEFWSGGKRWRCTDVGSRVIVAISLEPHKFVNYLLNADGASPGKPTRHLSEDPSWLNGPPYAIVEHVFDENDLSACSLTRESQ